MHSYLAPALAPAPSADICQRGESCPFRMLYALELWIEQSYPQCQQWSDDEWKLIAGLRSRYLRHRHSSRKVQQQRAAAEDELEQLLAASIEVVQVTKRRAARAAHQHQSK